jgi:hypothetical protein
MGNRKIADPENRGNGEKRGSGDKGKRAEEGSHHDCPRSVSPLTKKGEKLKQNTRLGG